MAVSESYRGRLGEWVKAKRLELSEDEAPVSFTKLEAEFIRRTGTHVPRATLSGWESGNFKREIAGDFLRAIADYAELSEDACRDWLSGKSDTNGRNRVNFEQVLAFIASCKDIEQLSAISTRSSAKLAAIALTLESE